MPIKSEATREQNVALAQMRAAFNASRLSEAAALFDRSPNLLRNPDAVLMRARIHLKTGAHLQAAELARRSNFKSASATQRGQRELILGIAETRSRLFDAADEHFQRAETYDPVLSASGELTYWVGRRHAESLERDAAHERLDALRRIGSAQSRIWADTLEAMLLCQTEQYGEAARVLVSQIEFLDRLDTPRIEDTIWALHTLSVIAREIDSPTVRQFVKVRAGSQQWNDADFASNHLQTLKAVAWCHALEGDYFNALRLLKAAQRLNVSPPWRAMVSLDRAYLARCFKERRFARDEIADAQEILDAISWRETRDEERVALLLAAELLADVDSTQAAKYLSTFMDMRDSMKAQLYLRYDRRLQAQADYTTGVVQTALGNRQAASAAYRRAWQVYDTIGYAWRAGRCALRLAELTRDQRWAEKAEEKLNHYSNSWLYDELRASSSSPNLPKLTNAQRQILDLIILGQNNQEISSSTGRSIYTIQNHVNAVLRAFDVPNRSALLAEAIRRGITRVVRQK